MDEVFTNNLDEDEIYNKVVDANELKYQGSGFWCFFLQNVVKRDVLFFYYLQVS